MNLLMFPSEFNSQSHSKEDADLRIAEEKKATQIYSINKSINKGSDKAIFLGGGLGFVASIIDLLTSSSDYSFFIVILGILFYVFLGCVVALIIRAVLNLRARKKIKETEESCESQKEYIKECAEKERNEYLKTFEAEVQTRSVEFANSELAQEVITWMSEGFYKNIDTTDRRSHIEKISVPFKFSVYTHKITCNLGTYDFKLKRCENLKSAIDQAALARAIASTIQLNVIMKYPNDISGTAVSIMIEYTYEKDCANVLISYVAPNGNYESVKKW